MKARTPVRLPPKRKLKSIALTWPPGSIVRLHGFRGRPRAVVKRFTPDGRSCRVAITGWAQLVWVKSSQLRPDDPQLEFPGLHV